VNRWKAFWRGDVAGEAEAEDLPMTEERPGGWGVRGWLRLAGGDNVIGMIQGDLVGSGLGR